MSDLALLDTMARQAEAQSAQHLAEARREAAKILEHAREKAAEHREAVWRSVHAEEAHKDRMSRQFAHVEADKARLAARNWAVHEVMGLVHEEVRDLVSSAEFPRVLERLLEEALAAAEGPVVAEVPAPHVEACRRAAGHTGAHVVDVIGSNELIDGVAVWDPERTMRISNTLTGRLSVLEERAIKHIVNRLFPGNK